MGSIEPPSAPYEVLSRYRRFSTPEEEFWWNYAGKTFSEMLKWTNSNIHEQYQFLNFFFDYIMPAFAAYRPFKHPSRAWSTGITPSGLPLEYSVNWRNATADAMLRVGVEPISQFSGTARDPYSHSKIWETLNSLAQAKGLPSFDLELWRYFSSVMCTSKEEEAELDRTTNYPPELSIAKMQHSMGFDLDGGEVIVKIYLIPNMKARVQKIPLVQLIKQSVHAMYGDTINPDTLHTVLNYLDQTSNFNDATWFSFDCIDKSRSRIKLYGCDYVTSLSKAEDLWTVGGKFTDPVTMKGLDYLRELWGLLPINDFETRVEDSLKNPPMLWAYELRPGQATPSPRIYIPGHCLHDKSVADGLSEFFTRVGWGDLGKGYTERLFQSFPHQYAKDSRALHTWIAFSYTEKTGVYVSCYYLGSSEYPTL